MPSTTPTVAQWQLGRELQQLRVQYGLTITQVAKVLEVTTSTVSRWEAAERVPREKELRQLTKYYELSVQDAEALLQLRRQAGKRGWWQSYDLEQRYGTFIGLEASASEIEAYTSTVVTGLLQTEDYARAIIAGVNHAIGQEDLERQIEVRKERVSKSLSSEGPKLWVILGESAVRQRVGGTRVLRHQLDHLLELCDHPNITLQVIPHQAGAHIGMVIPTFMILKLPQDGLSTVYMEGHRSNLFLESPQELRNHETIFNELRLVGIGGDMLQQLLTGIREDL